MQKEQAGNNAGRLILLRPTREAAGGEAAGAITDFAPGDAAGSGLDGYLSGDLGKLRQAGYSDEIDSLPGWEGAARAGYSGKALAGNPPADTFICAGCASTFEVAWALNEAGLLPEWGAVLALRQSSGRGQLRRPWHSPSGNLYVSFRLPGFFLEQEAASVLTAFLLIRAFSGLGLPLRLKWPNDLVLLESEPNLAARPGKLGGILLEERRGVLLAGLGLNCALRPDRDILREDAALQPAVLPENFSPRRPIPLWLQLVPALILLYEKLFVATPVRELLQRSEEFLLWKGSEVQVRDHYEQGSVITGVLSGLTELGGLRLLVRSHEPTPANGPRELALYSGSIKPAG